jgi:hypothetical protein
MNRDISKVNDRNRVERKKVILRPKSLDGWEGTT